MEYSPNSYYSYDYHHRPSDIISLNKVLTPLINQIQDYDNLRLALEQHGGRLAHLNRIAEILSKPFLIEGYFNPHKITLLDHSSINNMLNDIGDFNLHFDVRQLVDTGMPVYYLCRTYQDYWSEYSLIVQDIYKSPGYPMPDERFVKLMQSGHEVHFLRLSPFRAALTNMIEGNNGCTLEEIVDEILYHFGRHVFQASWNEDQRLGVMVAAYFGLESFRCCIELLYLCLSAELCELRLAIDEQMLRFFDQVYPQSAVHAFLKILTDLDGDTLNEIPQKALGLYTRLSHAFIRFLGISVIWGCRQIQIPLYKLIYGNFSRLEFIAKELKDKNEVNIGAGQLEAEAQAIIKEIISF